MSTFDSTKTPLPQIIREITDGKVQLPDFQRGWSNSGWHRLMSSVCSSRVMYFS